MVDLLSVLNFPFFFVFDRTGRLDEALACLRAFVARYPPNTVRESSPSSVPTRLPDMRSQRVSLVAGGRPLVRLTTALDVQDDVPLLLTFADIEVLTPSPRCGR